MMLNIKNGSMSSKPKLENLKQKLKVLKNETKSLNKLLKMVGWCSNMPARD